MDVVTARDPLELEAAGLCDMLQVGEADVGVAARGDALQQLGTLEATVAETRSRQARIIHRYAALGSPDLAWLRRRAAGQAAYGRDQPLMVVGARPSLPSVPHLPSVRRAPPASSSA